MNPLRSSFRTKTPAYLIRGQLPTITIMRFRPPPNIRVINRRRQAIRPPTCALPSRMKNNDEEKTIAP